MTSSKKWDRGVKPMSVNMWYRTLVCMNVLCNCLYLVSDGLERLKCTGLRWFGTVPDSEDLNN